MSITIEISESTERKIRDRAEKIGQTVDKVVGDLVEEVWDDHFPGEVASETSDKKLTINDLTGIFSSKSPVDTSTRASEIMRTELGLSSIGQE